MKKLIRTEQIKILHYTPFRILLLLYVIFFTLGIVIYPLIDRQIPVISLSDLFRFPDVWPFLTWITEPYNILLALIIIMITTNEFSNHTFKTQVIFGIERRDLVTQKILLILALALFATLLVGLTSLVMGLIHSYKITMGIALENMEMMAVYFLSSLTYMMYGLFFAMIIKNTALSILSFLALRTFVEPVLFLVFRDHEFRWFMPIRSLTRLTPLPNLIEIFQRKMEGGESIETSEMEILPKGPEPWINILVVAAYALILMWLCYRLMRRKRLT